MKRTLCTAAFGVGLLAAGCNWYDAKDSDCKPPAQRCDGDAIQICQPDISSGSPEGYEYHWETLLVCVDPEGLPPQTCGADPMFPGQVSCVEEGPDGGTEDDGAPTDAASSDSVREGPQTTSVHQAERAWLRVEVVRTARAFELGRVELATLDAMPLGVTAGEVAAVAYSGKKVTDATLVPMETHRQVVWLAATGVDRVALIKPSGEVLDERDVAFSATKARPSPALGVSEQALASDVPRTVKLLGPADQGRVSSDAARNMGELVEPTAEMLALVRRVHMRAPTLAASALTELGFTQGIDETTPWLRREGTMLLVNASDQALKAYRVGWADFPLAYLRALGTAFMSLAAQPTGKAVAASAFANDVAERIRDRISPLLKQGEGLEGLFRELQSLAVTARLAGEYSERREESLVPDDADPSAEQALHNGFFGRLGARNPTADFAELVASVHLVESWEASPCTDLSFGTLATVSARRMLPAAKLLVAHALGVISEAAFADCSRALLAQTPEEGFLLYPVTGEALRFGQKRTAFRDHHLRGETRLTGSAISNTEEHLIAVLDLAYKGRGTGLYRLVASGQREDPDEGAGFYLADPVNDLAAGAAGGLLLVRRTDRALEAIGLLVQPSAEVLGARIFPALTARFDSIGSTGVAP